MTSLRAPPPPATRVTAHAHSSPSHEHLPPQTSSLSQANLDFAHVWCASPAFTIPAGTLGVEPTTPGWQTWRAWPQPSSLTALTAEIPSPAGILHVSWSASARNATLALTVLAGQTASVCLPAPGAAPPALLHPSAAAAAAAAADALYVDGVLVPTPTVKGRFLCATQDLPPGAHVVTRVVAG